MRRAFALADRRRSYVAKVRGIVVTRRVPRRGLRRDATRAPPRLNRGIYDGRLNERRAALVEVPSRTAWADPKDLRWCGLLALA
jgi:hypothetical protein